MSWRVGKDIPAERAAAKRRVAAQIGALRASFYIPAPGQDAEYNAKMAAAQAFIAQGAPPDAAERWPMLASDAAVDGLTLSAAAAAILAQAAAWERALAATNYLRRRANNKIDAATTLAQIAAAEALASAEGLPKTEAALIAALEARAETEGAQNNDA